MPRKPKPAPRRAPVQLRDRALEEWIATQQLKHESPGQCVARLLGEYRALLSDPVIAGETERLRQVRALVDPERFVGAF